MQAVCDHLGRFQSYELGWPGSVTDVTMFKESELWLNKERYFEEDEYVLVDRGMEFLSKIYPYSLIYYRLSSDKVLNPPIQ